jgi:hypothetical protein
MAKHIIIESYVFTPSSRTVTINGKAIRREQLLLITNVTTNTVIYNFSDSTLTASAYSSTVVPGTTYQGNVETTTITLTYNTTSMSSTDKLAILVEESYQETIPAETYMDPVGKMRVSTPQAMIDTDFEYGVQSTKWETVNLLNNRPGCFYDPTAPITGTSSSPTFYGSNGSYLISAITGNGTRLVTVTVNNTVGITAGTPVYIQETTDVNANGWYMPFNVVSNTSFQYYARNNVTNGNIFDVSKSLVFVGAFYTGSGLNVLSGAGNSFTYSGSTITVTTQFQHAITVGSYVMFTGLTASTNAPNGTWQVLTTPTANSFTVVSAIGAPTGSISTTAGGTSLTINTTAVSGAITAVAINAAGSGYANGDTLLLAGGTAGYIKVTSVSASGAVLSVQIFGQGSGYSSASGVSTSYYATQSAVYLRPWGQGIHRAFDGGVSFQSGYPYHGQQMVRQTRRTFRYQSGKGIQFSTGSNMCAPFWTDSLTSSGTTVTVTTKYPHNLGVGAVIKVSGSADNAYNGTFTVVSVPTDLTLTYTAGSTPGTSPALGTPITVQPYQWYGSNTRIGFFTQQNGFFFQYDGQTVSAVRRNSTTQLKGYCSVLAYGSQTLTGTNTRFTEELSPMDMIVIRGMSYTVTSIESNTGLTISPDYRGQTIFAPQQIIMSKTVDTIIPQSQWVIDRFDGTGPSQNTLDITKIQMWYLDYTWYGAGAIRWGFKDQRGEVRYVHRLAHGNNQTSAYMRSGNLPGRYEIDTFVPKTTITSTVNSGDTTISVASNVGFPTAGTLVLINSGVTGTIEYVNYTGKSSTTGFTGVTRAVTNLSGPGNPSGANMGGNASAQTFTYSATAPVLVQLHSPQVSVTISHWGSSVMMDGRYDSDASLVFVAGMSTAISNIGAGVTQPLISIRIGPSVDSGITGILGQREVMNTMQLLMRAVDAYTTGTGMTFLITLRLNGVISGGTFASAGGSSLAQVCYHTGGQTISGGETMYGFFTTTPGVTSGDLTAVRDIGNSIIGGGTSLNVPITPQGKYPDGPDIVTVCATNVTAVTTNSINARLSWTEAAA